ncbi:uncharacterized protein BJ171DRAFT_585760 [Polychytrium aggregatum]|uniref:uncharacterized protein n=1 Tax=Polychytrium aggregatum TaxID=110093 RepID=UPI0022FED6EF|nr:uncharacterized protein BJ171DRAFT_585760 [Polychytrium aggregatum]KAI9197245.1 hypothetical protein BJ171DRAFT_585760 [Polychytrium aggregatum]
MGAPNMEHESISIQDASTFKMQLKIQLKIQLKMKFKNITMTHSRDTDQQSQRPKVRRTKVELFKMFATLNVSKEVAKSFIDLFNTCFGESMEKLPSLCSMKSHLMENSRAGGGDRNPLPNRPSAKKIRRSGADSQPASQPAVPARPPGSSRIESSLNHHDLITILVCNSAFIASIDPAVLVTFPDLAPQYENILSLISEAGWAHLTQSHMRSLKPGKNYSGANGYFNIAKTIATLTRGVNASVCRKDLLEGIFHFLMRIDGYPRSFQAYQKELPLWWAASESKALAKKLRRYLCLEFPFCLESYDSGIADIKLLGRTVQFKLFDSARILEYIGPDQFPDDIGYDEYYSGEESEEDIEYTDDNDDDSPFDMSEAFRETGKDDCVLWIARFETHPFLTTEQRSKLLPHEAFVLKHRQCSDLHFVNCSFASVSGFPKSLDDLQTLTFHESLSTVKITSTGQFPRMPRLSSLSMPSGILSFDGVPSCRDWLSRFWISDCNDLASLEGFPSSSQLTELVMPSGIVSLKGMPHTLPDLTKFDLSRCDQVVDMEGFPHVPKVEELLLPPQLRSIDNLGQYFGNLRVLDIGRCQINSLRGLPDMPKLNILKLPPPIQTLEGLPLSLDALESLDMWRCHRLVSLKGLHPMPSLSSLRLPESNISLKSISDWVAWLKNSRKWKRHVDAEDRLVSVFPRLRTL